MASDLEDFHINLAKGWPDTSLFTSDFFNGAMKGFKPTWMQYSESYGGDNRPILADYLSERYHVSTPISPDNLFITTGVSHGIDLISHLLLKPGDIVLSENPSYFLAKKIFQDHSATIVGVPTDISSQVEGEGGINIAALRQAIAEHGGTGRIKLLYLVPTFNNPKGFTMSIESRQLVVDLCQEHDITIIADEVYQLLPFPNCEVPIPMAGMADNVVSVSSFAKILAPGIRVGWIQADHRIVEQLCQIGYIVSGGTPCHFSSNLVFSAIQQGLLDSHISILSQTYQERHDYSIDAFHHFLPSAEVTPVKGGFFFWVSFPQADFDTNILLDVAEKQCNLSFKPGSVCCVEDSSTCLELNRKSLRFCFAFYNQHILVTAVQRLAEAIHIMNSQLSY